MEDRPGTRRPSILSRLLIPGVATIVAIMALALPDPLRDFLLWTSVPVLVIGLQLALALSWQAFRKENGNPR